MTRPPLPPIFDSVSLRNQALRFRRADQNRRMLMVRRAKGQTTMKGKA